MAPTIVNLDFIFVRFMLASMVELFGKIEWISDKSSFQSSTQHVGRRDRHERAGDYSSSWHG